MDANLKLIKMLPYYSLHPINDVNVRLAHFEILLLLSLASARCTGCCWMKALEMLTLEYRG